MKALRSYLLMAVIVLTTAAACTKTKTYCPRCEMGPDPGMCLAAMEAYYFNKKTGTCEVFAWGGCGEVPFKTLEDCIEHCGKVEKK